MSADLKYIVGDLVRDAEQFDVVIHGCNCFNTMGAGIAVGIRKKFPEAYKIDCETQYGDTKKLGTFTYTKEQTTPVIVNAYTQYRYGNDRRHADYDAIRSCMKGIKELFSGKKIALPLIGAGLAGGDWEVIEVIIKEELLDEDVTIIKWEKDVI